VQALHLIIQEHQLLMVLVELAVLHADWQPAQTLWVPLAQQTLVTVAVAHLQRVQAVKLMVELAAPD
jgi:hypothetical protein